MNPDVEIDARRLLCPLPVLRLQNSINKQAVGAQVQITCTDPGALNDIPAWTNLNGHQVISVVEKDDEYVFVVEKQSDGS